MAATFRNDSPFGVVVHYTVGEKGSPQRGTSAPVVVAADGGLAALPDLNPAADMRLVVQASTSTLDPVNMDWATVPDAVVLSVPAPAQNVTMAGLASGPFRYSYSFDAATAAFTFTAQVRCGDWATNAEHGCPAILGLTVDSCTGFRAADSSAGCRQWCLDNPGPCFAMKQTLCSDPGSQATWEASPECVCQAKDKSRVRLPDTLGRTYTQFRDLLRQAGVSRFDDDACWYPGCLESQGALLTKDQAFAKCPVDQPVQVCVAFAKNITVSGGQADDASVAINFVNDCCQAVGGGQCGGDDDDTPAASPPPPEPDLPPARHPGGGPGTPEDPVVTFLQSPAGIAVLVVSAVVVVALVITGVVVSVKQRNAQKRRGGVEE